MFDEPHERVQDVLVFQECHDVDMNARMFPRA